MLRFLSVRNLAVIERAEVEFGPGFNVLTGETGAGKSMLVEAVGLLLGGRASTDVIRTGETSATIQAVFEQNGEELIVRREILEQGRSRAFVGDQVVTAGALKERAEGLVELHGQHEHQALLNAESHLDLLDEFAGLSQTRGEVQATFEIVARLTQELDTLQLDAREKAARLDLLTFQRGEIDRAAPRTSEDEELATTRGVLANAERLRLLCAEAYAGLYESDQAALGALGQVWRRVGDLAVLEPRFALYLDARDGIKSQLEDLAFFLRAYGDAIDASPQRLQEVEDRLALLERLKRKFGPTLDDVCRRRDEFDEQIAGLNRSDERAGEVRAELESAEAAFLKRAQALSRARRKAAVDFSAALERQLADLAMERTRIEVRFADADVDRHAWSVRGIDRAEFFLSPNPGEDLRPLARIASGGELSRIMLALKTLGVAGAAGKTLVFDEVDAGIGGRVADVVGRKLRTLGEEFQVFCITHLPQIAAYGTVHFAIQKHVQGTRTVTTVQRLDDRARVDELARMIGGEGESSEQVRGSAAELLARGTAWTPASEYKTKGERAKAKERNRRIG